MPFFILRNKFKLMRSLLYLLCFCLTTLSFAQKQRGKASFYDQKFEGRTTANGETFSQNQATAAHKTLPFNSMVKVTNLTNGKSAIVRINDRGPFIRGRIIDLTTKTAKELGFFEEGLADVEIELLTDTKSYEIEDTVTSIENKTTETKENLNETKQAVKSTNVRESLATSSPTRQAPVKEEAKIQQNQVEKVESTHKHVASPSGLPQITGETKEILEVFALDIKAVDKTFFGVQIASFTDATYLMRFASEIKTAYKEQVMVLSKIQADRKLYTLVLGQFDKREGAERFMQKVKSSYPDSFIVEVNQ